MPSIPITTGTLFSAVAGSWPNTGGDSNIVPVVANGKVYVASDQAVSIFGIGGAKRKVTLPIPVRVDMRVALAQGEHEVYGTVLRIDGTIIDVRTRDGPHGQDRRRDREVEIRSRAALGRPRADGARHFRRRRDDEGRPDRPRQGQPEDVAGGQVIPHHHQSPWPGLTRPPGAPASAGAPGGRLEAGHGEF